MMKELLAPSYSVVDTFPDPELLTDAPTMVKLDENHYLCAVPVIAIPLDEKGQHKGFESLYQAGEVRFQNKMLHIYRSRDGGETWVKGDRIMEFICGHLFCHEETVYYIGVGPGRRDIRITSSQDQGETWQEPVRLFEGMFYAAGGSMARRDGRLYWTVNAANEEGRFNTSGARLLALAGDLGGDLMSVSAWRRSEYLLFPGLPDQLRFNLSCRQVPHFLEPNTILVNQRLKILSRVRIDFQATAHIASVCELTDNEEGLRLEFKQYYPVPGAQNQFYITRDPTSELLWMTSNLPVCTQDDFTFPKVDTLGYYGRGNDRRFLWLYYGMDGLNWFPAGCVARGEKPAQAFNYCSTVVDNDDLLMVSRTSRDMADQHNNDLVTFHRIRGFRELAMCLL